MASTTNYSWSTPDDTALVKDGAAAIRTLGSSIDTTTKALNPSTTLGDIEYRSATANTNTRLALGTAGQVLTVNSGATAPEWATPGTADNFALINAGGTALTGAATITVSGISGKNRLFVYVDAASSANASSTFTIRFNSDSATNYRWAGQFFNPTTFGAEDSLGDGFTVATMGNNASNVVSLMMHVEGTNAAGIKPITFSTRANGSTTSQHKNINGFYSGSSTISSVSIISSTGDFDSGTIFVYGA